MPWSAVGSRMMNQQRGGKALVAKRFLTPGPSPGTLRNLTPMFTCPTKC